MIHGSTSHAPRPFGMPIEEPPPRKPNPLDVEDTVIQLRKKRNSYEFEIRSRSRKQKTIDKLRNKIHEINRQIEELGFPPQGKRGKRKKGQMR